MRNRILLSIKIKFKEGRWICKSCGISLRHYNPMDGFDTYWCPKCNSWRWLGYNIPGVPIRRTPQIEYLDPSEKKSMSYMQKIMDKYEEEMEEKLDGEVVVYSCKVQSQKFLFSLIPSMKGKNPYED